MISPAPQNQNKAIRSNRRSLGASSARQSTALAEPILLRRIEIVPQPILPPIPEPLTEAIESAEAVALKAPRTAPGEQTDDQLVARAQAGDKRAFELLVRKYQTKVIALVARFVGDGDAPDVAQDAMIKAYRALKGFRGQSAFYTWLYRIGINTAKNHLIARGRRPIGQDIDILDAEQYGHTEHLSDLDTPESLILADEIKAKILEAISALPAELHRAITLRELEGMSYEEIAEEMDCPIGTVRSRIFRAREAVDAVVGPLLA